MKTYKLRFVQMSMLLIGSVLFCILVIVYGYCYADRLASLELTMREMLEPLSRQDPYVVPDDAERSHFVTVFVGTAGTDDLAVFSLSADYDEAILADLVGDVLQSDADFGLLKDRGFYFFRRGMSSGYKIAMADDSYITHAMNGLLALLFGSWVCAMLLFYFISLLFARIAVKPVEQARQREAQFIADISHDLKTPLSVIMANNEIILNAVDFKMETGRKWVTGSQEAAQNMRSMITQMLDLYAAESQEYQLNSEKFDLSEAVERTVIQLEALAWERNVRMNAAIQENIALVADPQVVSRILNILIDNALKYEPTDGEVSIHLYREGKYAVFAVQNHAIISPDDLPHIYERFYRADKVRCGGGHGLGLAIAQKLAERSEAYLKCTSSPKDGTAFLLRFKAENILINP